MIAARIKSSEGDKTFRFTCVGATGQILHKKFNQDHLVKVRLHGELARVCGRDIFELAVTSVRETLSAIHHLTKQKSTKLFIDLHDKVRWNIKVNGHSLDGSDPNVGDLMCIEQNLDTVEIYPVMQGSKFNWLEAILGALLIVVGIVLMFIPGGQFLGVPLGIIGFNLALGGVALLLGGLITLFASPSQGKSPGVQQKATGTPSYLFSGSINVVNQGGPVPIAYGKVICGSVLIAATITSNNIIYVGAPNATSGTQGRITGSANPPQVTPTAADITPISVTPLMQDYMDLLGLTEWPDGIDVLTAQPGAALTAPKYAIKHWDGSFGLIYSTDITDPEVNPFSQMINTNIVVGHAVDPLILNYVNPNSVLDTVQVPVIGTQVPPGGKLNLLGPGWFFVFGRARLSTVNKIKVTYRAHTAIFPTLGPWKNFKVLARFRANHHATLH